MTIADLKKWLADLPPEFDNGYVGAFLGGDLGAFTAKRVIAFKSKDGTLIGIGVNSMGTHISDKWADKHRIVRDRKSVV